MRNILLLSSLVIMIFTSSVFTQELNQTDVSTQDKLLLQYNTDVFDDNTKTWQYFSIEYQFKETFATFIPRANFANRFTNSEIQLEADAYTIFSKKTYLYLNTGFAEGKVFPKSRAGIELYQVIPGNIELSAGYRYLYFSPSKVNIITGSIGYYLGDYWISFRPYFVNEPGSEKKSTFTIIGRKYFVDGENYLSVKAGFGSYPVSGNTQADFFRNDSKFFGVDYQFYILEKTTIQLGFLYENEELNINSSRSRYNFLFGVQKIFP
ncbi:MAG: YaiO family outer membrane beta-barrel protein [Ignavibacterium sp.]|nr:YaiO family outer membrane beta-barrel protein [Ignavibacterium sp.]